MTTALIVLFETVEENQQHYSSAFVRFSRRFEHHFDARYFILNNWQRLSVGEATKVYKASYSNVYSMLTRMLDDVKEDAVLITDVFTLIHDPEIVLETLKDIETYQVVAIRKEHNFKILFEPFFFAARTHILKDIAREYSFAEYGNFPAFGVVSRELLNRTLRIKELPYEVSTCVLKNNLQIERQIAQNQRFYRVMNADLAAALLSDIHDAKDHYKIHKETYTFSERMLSLMWHFHLKTIAGDQSEMGYVDVLDDHNVPISTWIRYWQEFTRTFDFARLKPSAQKA